MIKHEPILPNNSEVITVKTLKMWKFKLTDITFLFLAGYQSIYYQYCYLSITLLSAIGLVSCECLYFHIIIPSLGVILV